MYQSKQAIAIAVKSGFIPHALINFDLKNLTTLLLDYSTRYVYYGVGL